MTGGEINSVHNSILLIKNFPHAIHMIPFKNITMELCEIAVDTNPTSLKDIPIKFISKNLIIRGFERIERHYLDQIIGIVPMYVYDDDICGILIRRFGIETLPVQLISQKFIEYHLSVYGSINMEIRRIRDQIIANANHFINMKPVLWLDIMQIFEKGADIEIEWMKKLLILAIVRGLPIDRVPDRWIDHQVIMEALHKDFTITIPKKLMSDTIYMEMIRRKSIQLCDIPDEYHTIELMHMVWRTNSDCLNTLLPEIIEQSLL